MNLTKQEMMKIIKEELDKVTASDVRKDASASARETGASGITDQERGLIKKLQSQLTTAAKSGNVATGRALKLAQMLSAELSKMSEAQSLDELAPRKGAMSVDAAAIAEAERLEQMYRKAGLTDKANQIRKAISAAEAGEVNIMQFHKMYQE